MSFFKTKCFSVNVLTYPVKYAMVFTTFLSGFLVKHALLWDFLNVSVNIIYT